MERHEPEIPGCPHHLHRHREIELDLGRHGQGVLLASVLPPPAGSELRQPGSPRRRGQGDAVLARSRRGRSASGRRAVSDRARGDDLREPRGDPPHPEANQEGARRVVSGPDAAGGGEPVAGRRATVFRRRRRMPHGVPLPADAAHVHGAAAGRPSPDRRDPAADARDSGELPVGDVPPESRRAHAGNGDGRRTRLHVSRVCRGPADADQCWNPASARAAAGEQPPPHRAAAQPALLHAGYARHLLRRRAWHGRQHLPRRSERRPHADAMDRRSQRRILARRSGASLRAADHGSGLRLPGDQRRGAGAIRVSRS